MCGKRQYDSDELAADVRILAALAVGLRVIGCNPHYAVTGHQSVRTLSSPSFARYQGE